MEKDLSFPIPFRLLSKFKRCANATLKFKTSHTSIHSGIYDKAVLSAVEQMYIFYPRFILKKKINIPDYYENPPNISMRELDNNNSIESGQKDNILKSAGVKSFKIENDYDY
jgi:hypothetical protein